MFDHQEAFRLYGKHHWRGNAGFGVEHESWWDCLHRLGYEQCSECMRYGYYPNEVSHVYDSNKLVCDNPVCVVHAEARFFGMTASIQNDKFVGTVITVTAYNGFSLDVSRTDQYTAFERAINLIHHFHLTGRSIFSYKDKL